MGTLAVNKHSKKSDIKSMITTYFQSTYSLDFRRQIGPLFRKFCPLFYLSDSLFLNSETNWQI